VGGVEVGGVLLEELDHGLLRLDAVVLVILELEGALGADDGEEDLELFRVKLCYLLIAFVVDSRVVMQDVVVEDLCGDVVLGGVIGDLLAEEEVEGGEDVVVVVGERSGGGVCGRDVAESEERAHVAHGGHGGGVDGGGEDVVGVEEELGVEGLAHGLVDVEAECEEVVVLLRVREGLVHVGVGREEVGLGEEDIGDEEDGVAPLEGGGVGEEDQVSRVEEDAEGVDDVEALSADGLEVFALDEDEGEVVNLVVVDGLSGSEDLDEAVHDVGCVHGLVRGGGATEDAVDVVCHEFDRAEVVVLGMGLAEDALVGTVEVGRRHLSGWAEGEEGADEELRHRVRPGLPPGLLDGLCRGVLAVLEDSVGVMLVDDLLRVLGLDVAADDAREGIDEVGTGVGVRAVRDGVHERDEFGVVLVKGEHCVDLRGWVCVGEHHKGSRVRVGFTCVIHPNAGSLVVGDQIRSCPG